MSICQHCGTQSGDGFLFCIHCGQKLDAAPAPEPMPGGQPEMVFAPPAVSFPEIEPVPVPAAVPVPEAAFQQAPPAPEMTPIPEADAVSPPTFTPPPAYTPAATPVPADAQPMYVPQQVYGPYSPPTAEPAASAQQPVYPQQPAYQQPYGQPYAAYPPAYGQPYPQGGYPPAYPGMPAYGMPADPVRVQEAGRRLLGSPLVVALAVTYAVQVLLTIISTILTVSSNSWNSNSSGDGSYITVVLLGMAPAVLLAVGWLLCWRSAHNLQMPLSSSGLSMIRIVRIVLMVLICALLVLMMLGLFVILAANDSLDLDMFDFGEFGGYDLHELLELSAAILLGAVILAAGVIITYFIFNLKALNSAITAIRTGQPKTNGIMAFGVISFIFAGFMVLGLIGSLTDAYADAPMSILSSCASILINLLNGLLAMKAGAELKKIY